jgi:putative PIG3 family NAD(P)H quinone oxidoreductase
MMRAVIYLAGKAVVGERPVPHCGDDDVLVDVAFAGLNRADVLERLGRYGSPPTADGAAIPGLELAGTIRTTGANVRDLHAGDRVCALVTGGAHAEVARLPAATAVVLPDSLALADAAALPEAYITADDALFTLGELRLGETVLIHAVGSGVGLAALALARLAGARTIGTSRSPTKLGHARRLGLDVALLLDSFPQDVLEATGGRGADVILDCIGPTLFDRNVAALSPRGRIVQIGTLGGGRAEVGTAALMSKRGRWIGTVLRSRPLDEKIALTRSFAARIMPLVAAGKLSAHVEHFFPLAAISDAHRYMEEDRNVGKIVLALRSG